MALTFGSLFTGFGGFDLGLEWAGMEVRWQVEIDDYARRVLARHWPCVRRYNDIRTFPSDDGEYRVDVIAGGFPCQPTSVVGATSGRRRGEADERWMWPDMRRVVGVVQPRIVVIENPPGLLSMGLGDRVRRDLESDGYETDPWVTVSACSAGAATIRRRVFLVAHRDSFDWKRRGILADLDFASNEAEKHPPEWEWHGGTARYRGQGNRRLGPFAEGWASEPGLVRVVDGVRDRVVQARHRGIGNAVVPQVAELVGRRIVETFGA